MTANLYTMSKNAQSCCCSSSAVAGTSARIMMALDTAMLAVSIIIISLISLFIILVYP